MNNKRASMRPRRPKHLHEGGKIEDEYALLDGLPCCCDFRTSTNKIARSTYLITQNSKGAALLKQPTN